MKFKVGDLVEFVEYGPRSHARFHLHLHLKNTLFLVTKTFPASEVWEGKLGVDFTEEDNAYICLSCVGGGELWFYEDELKEVNYADSF